MSATNFYITFLRPEMYAPMFYISIALLCLLPVISYLPSNRQTLLRQPAPFFLPLTTTIYTILLIVILGYRYPFWTRGDYFADTWLYTHTWMEIDDYEPISRVGEWLFYNMMYLVKSLGASVNDFYLLVAFLYIGLMAVACVKLFQGKWWFALLFCLSSFSFYGAAVNGLRSGLSSSMAMLSLALLTGSKPEKIGGALLLLSSVFVHSSMKMVIACILVAMFVFKQPKQATYLWLVCIVLSAITGSLFNDIIVSLGLNDRLNEYILSGDNQDLMKVFSHTGFRWDFLLYSSPPVVLAWYVTVKRNFQDKTYNLLICTYIVANSLWVMMIRMPYNNRIAYLSWFLYPIVIAYPLLRFNIWKDQDRKAVIALLVYAAFTFFMQFIYYGGKQATI